MSCRGVLSWIVLCCAVPWRVMLRCVGLEGNALFGFALRCVENPWVDPHQHSLYLKKCVQPKLPIAPRMGQLLVVGFQKKRKRLV